MKNKLDALIFSTSQLSEGKTKTVFVLRFGLKGGEALSLGKIGKELGISRERVRQIEESGFEKIKKAKKSHDFYILENRVLKIMKESGHFCEKDILKERLISNPSITEANKLMFLLNCSNKLEYRRSFAGLRGFWLEKGKADYHKIVQLEEQLVQFMEKQKKPLFLKDFLKSFQKSDYESPINLSGMGSEEETLKFFENILFLNKKFKKNILGEWGIINWKEISEKGNSQKAYLVLKLLNKSLHYKEISEKIGFYWNDKKTIAQTVHNELIKDERFVLVGRGIYGLKEWGYKKGTVRDLIIECLKECGRPLHKKDLVDYVLKQREVKEMTVLINLGDQKYFEKLSKGRYNLKKS
ncbi:MAG: sigma factor-like helix-turn-helix DNA-binding protein [Patescibacteria group bacterium]